MWPVVFGGKCDVFFETFGQDTNGNLRSGAWRWLLLEWRFLAVTRLCGLEVAGFGGPGLAAGDTAAIERLTQYIVRYPFSLTPAASHPPPLCDAGDDEDTPYRKKCRQRWATLIKKVYEINPLLCPSRAGGRDGLTTGGSQQRSKAERQLRCPK